MAAFDPITDRGPEGHRVICRVALRLPDLRVIRLVRP